VTADGQAARPADEGLVARAVPLVGKDETGVIQSVNEAMSRVLGWSPEDLVGRRSLEFIHPQDHGTAYSGWVRLLAEPGGRQRMRVRHSDSAGRWVWVEVVNHNLLADPECGMVLAEVVPVDGTPQDESAWISSHLLRRLTDALPLGVLQFDQARRIVFSNERLALVVGRPVARTVDEQFAGVVPADHAGLRRALDAVLTGEDVDVELSLAHPDLGVRRCALVLRALVARSGTKVTGAIVCVSDVTEQARWRAEIERRATHDDLTGCLNRVAVQVLLGQALSGAAPGSGVSVVFVDVDHLKAVNDEHGHAAGDRLLLTIAGRLRSAARGAELVGRIGGDEFLVVCPGMASPQEALRTGRSLAASVRKPVDLGRISLTPSASIGVAWSDDPGQDAQTLVARADAAMYESKRDRLGATVLAQENPVARGWTVRSPPDAGQ
jgi:diguanylate cyclase (GGDEF)-like protein/PAS domain S-box-containing protein